MRRVFTQTMGRYQAGEVRDWPRSTWDTFFPDWRKITADPDEATQRAPARAARKKEKTA